jgi:hypothetical protein
MTRNLIIAIYSITLLLLGSNWLFAADNALAKFSYTTSFAEGKWNQSDWFDMRSASSDIHGEWIQNKDHISNKVPDGEKLEDVIKENQNKLFISKLLNHKLSGTSEISSTMSWDKNYAPLIVIASAPESVQAGLPFSRNYIEVVIYEKGINIWQHFYKDGKQSYKKVAWIDCSFKAKKKYKLEVSVRAKELYVKVGNYNLGVNGMEIPENYYVGITACEGINRFYDFSVIAK